MKNCSKKIFRIAFLFIATSVFLLNEKSDAQTSYNAAASYSLRKVNTTYTGSAIKVRRSCDNATADIGFTSCGNLDTVTLKTFVMAANPVSAISATVDAAYGLRKLKCSYNGSAIQVRRSCDNATKDIGFTTTGDLDTTALKNFVLSASPLSSISASAACAFSLRKLRCNYAGHAIRVRRSNDNATQDIGFTASGDLDTATLKTFVGANNGFVTIWYDQSGNGNNASQATTGNQPRIVSSGVVQRQNSVPAIYFNSAITSYLQIPYAAGSLNLSTASSTNAVLARNGVVSGVAAVFAQVYAPSNISAALAWNNSSASAAPLSIGFFPGSWQYAALGTDVTLSQTNIITGNITSGASNTSTISLYQNGTLAASASNKTTVGAIAAQPYNIGKRWDNPDYAPMQLQELIVFASNLSTTNRQFIEWNQAQYYNVSGPTLTTLPSSPPSAYISIWYDQSGNGYNTAQATTGNQPRIVSAGVIDRWGGKPCIYFDGTASYLQNNTYSLLLNSQTPTWNAVIVPIATNTAYSPIVSWRLTGGVVSQLEVGPNNNWNTSWWSNSNYATTNGTTLSNGSYQILTALTNATSTQLYYNGSLSFNNTGQTNPAATAGSPSTSGSVALIIGQDFGFGTRFIKGYIPEIILSSGYFSTTDRQYVEWSQAQYYGVSGPTLTTIPASAPSGYIDTWYDQSGNGKNATQSTTGNQPTIINAGVLNLQNSTPIIKFNGTTQYLAASAVSSTAFNNTAGGTLNTIALNNGASSWQGLAQQGRNSSPWWGIWGSNTAKWTGGFNSGPTNISAVAGSSVYATATLVQVPSSSTTLFINGASGATSASTSNVANSQSFYIGYGATGSEYWNGAVSEVNVFASNINTTRRTLLETNQGAYYGISVSNSKYTPPVAGTYNLFVAGVGRESSTDSVAATRSTVGLGFTVGQTASDFLKDNGDYITAGITCPISYTTSTSNLPATVFLRWSNVWYIDKTDVGSNNGNVGVYFDFSDNGTTTINPGTASNYVLLYRTSTAGTFSIVAGTTPTVSGDKVIFTVNASNISDNYYTIGTKDPILSPLPVELMDFSCNKIQPRQVELKWTTASETNNDYFTVERSLDGINFETIGMMKGEGNSSELKNYSMHDNDLPTGDLYYRLKQTDYDGSFKYSEMCVTTIKSSASIFIYPNPANDILFVEVEESSVNNVFVRDNLGKEINCPINMESSKATIDVSMMPPGFYYLQLIFENGQTENKKIIIE